MNAPGRRAGGHRRTSGAERRSTNGETVHVDRREARMDLDPPGRRIRHDQVAGQSAAARLVEPDGKARGIRRSHTACEGGGLVDLDHAIAGHRQVPVGNTAIHATRWSDQTHSGLHHRRAVSCCESAQGACLTCEPCESSRGSRRGYSVSWSGRRRTPCPPRVELAGCVALGPPRDGSTHPDEHATGSPGRGLGCPGGACASDRSVSVASRTSLEALVRESLRPASGRGEPAGGARAPGVLDGLMPLLVNVVGSPRPPGSSHAGGASARFGW